MATKKFNKEHKHKLVLEKGWMTKYFFNSDYGLLKINGGGERYFLNSSAISLMPNYCKVKLILYSGPGMISQGSHHFCDVIPPNSKENEKDNFVEYGPDQKGTHGCVPSVPISPIHNTVTVINLGNGKFGIPMFLINDSEMPIQTAGYFRFTDTRIPAQWNLAIQTNINNNGAQLNEFSVGIEKKIEIDSAGQYHFFVIGNLFWKNEIIWNNLK